MTEMAGVPGDVPYSDELEWPAGLVPMKFFDDDGSMRVIQ